MKIPRSPTARSALVLISMTATVIAAHAGEDPPRPSQGRQPAEQIGQLEHRGALPTLDRGTDIAGPDENHNGVRDDIDAYIAALPVTEPQRRAVAQRARQQQAKLLVDPLDKQAVLASSERSMAAAHCMWERFNRHDDLSSRIEAMTPNTPERAKRYFQYMAALSGSTISRPNGDTCEP